MKEEEGIDRVTIKVPSKLYTEYKKALMDLQTNTTHDLLDHIKEVVENSEENITGYEVNEKVLRRNSDAQLQPNGEDEKIHY